MNTVQFYLPEDAKHNSAVDKEPFHYSSVEARDLMQTQKREIPQKYIYRDPIWVFTNSDVNGCGSYDFANHGKLDLRSPRWKESLGGHILLALLKNRQYKYVAAVGGYCSICEADEDYNDYNRCIIDAMKTAYGRVFLGSINLDGAKRQEVLDGKSSVYTEYVGQKIYNGGYEFCVPVADEELEQLIRGWNGDDRLPKKWVNVEAITGRVRDVGGEYLIWY